MLRALVLSLCLKCATLVESLLKNFFFVELQNKLDGFTSFGQKTFGRPAHKLISS